MVLNENKIRKIWSFKISEYFIHAKYVFVLQDKSTESIFKFRFPCAAYPFDMQ